MHETKENYKQGYVTGDMMSSSFMEKQSSSSSSSSSLPLSSSKSPPSLSTVAEPTKKPHHDEQSSPESNAKINAYTQYSTSTTVSCSSSNTDRIQPQIEKTNKVAESSKLPHSNKVNSHDDKADGTKEQNITNDNISNHESKTDIQPSSTTATTNSDDNKDDNTKGTTPKMQETSNGNAQTGTVPKPKRKLRDDKNIKKQCPVCLQFFSHIKILEHAAYCTNFGTKDPNGTTAVEQRPKLQHQLMQQEEQGKSTFATASSSPRSSLEKNSLSSTTPSNGSDSKKNGTNSTAIPNTNSINNTSVAKKKELATNSTKKKVSKKKEPSTAAAILKKKEQSTTAAASKKKEPPTTIPRKKRKRNETEHFDSNTTELRMGIASTWEDENDVNSDIDEDYEDIDEIHSNKNKKRKKKEKSLRKPPTFQSCKIDSRKTSANLKDEVIISTIMKSNQEKLGKRKKKMNLSSTRTDKPKKAKRNRNEEQNQSDPPFDVRTVTRISDSNIQYAFPLTMDFGTKCWYSDNNQGKSEKMITNTATTRADSNIVVLPITTKPYASTHDARHFLEMLKFCAREMSSAKVSATTSIPNTTSLHFPATQQTNGNDAVLKFLSIIQSARVGKITIHQFMKDVKQFIWNITTVHDCIDKDNDDCGDCTSNKSGRNSRSRDEMQQYANLLRINLMNGFELFLPEFYRMERILVDDGKNHRSKEEEEEKRKNLSSTTTAANACDEVGFFSSRTHIECNWMEEEEGEENKEDAKETPAATTTTSSP